MFFSFISVFESRFSFFVSRSFHETSYLRLIGQEEIASDWWRVTCSCVALCSHVRLSIEPFNPYAYLLLVGHLYLWSFLLVSCIYSPNSPTHIFRPASVKFVNKSSYTSIYSHWYTYFVQDLTVKMGKSRPTTRSRTPSLLLILEWRLGLRRTHLSFNMTPTYRLF